MLDRPRTSGLPRTRPTPDRALREVLFKRQILDTYLVAGGRYRDDRTAKDFATWQGYAFAALDLAEILYDGHPEFPFCPHLEEAWWPCDGPWVATPRRTLNERTGT